MGVDFVALLPHRLAPDELELFPEEFRVGRFPALVAYMRDNVAYHHNAANWPIEWSWEIHQPAATIQEQLAQESVVELESPGGVHYTFSRSLCRVYHVTRWSAFIKDVEVQSMLRRACYELSGFLRGDRAIYLPDSNWHPSAALDAIDDGRNIDEVESWLSANCGEPAKVLHEIYSERQVRVNNTVYDVREGDGYFIDTFADLKA